MIQFENVSKYYENSAEPVVQNLTLAIPEGETCVVIGPSGCGKTTVLKMVNRLIEPTSGAIFVGGRNVLKQDPIELRRNIGYVIQQVGLFPHFTIRENIAVVPQLLGWKKPRIEHRVNELLDIVGLEPTLYRERYPQQLSGGQRQRVGVARALAADPPVMLMDEPFGAIDPITRDRLQNEFLRLQRQLKKTILFVTHDIEEALKIGTLVCILQVGGRLQQLDRPANILSRPVNRFVADFVGADRGLKKLTLGRVQDVMTPILVKGSRHESGTELVHRMQQHGQNQTLILDGADTLIGYVTLEAARLGSSQQASDLLQNFSAATNPDTLLRDAFSEMLRQGLTWLPVLAGDRHPVGVLNIDDVQRFIQQD